MPYVLLEYLSQAQLPVDLHAAEAIHKLLALKAAGLVVAEIPAFLHDHKGGNYVSAARVTAVTPAGTAAVKKRRA
ncbi:MAG: hypothetical protein ACRYGA_11470 [Janthinobacterium lividum]